MAKAKQTHSEDENDDYRTVPVNDYSGVPREIVINENDIHLGQTEGTSTGEDENAVEAGGWAGTDDATSTAASDQSYSGEVDPNIHAVGLHPEKEDPTGRAYGGGLDPDGGGVVDLTGSPVEESRDWEEDPV